nr:MAG TPA: hypothetical protein [Caudoviricetes sp.]
MQAHREPQRLRQQTFQAEIFAASTTQIFPVEKTRAWFMWTGNTNETPR